MTDNPKIRSMTIRLDADTHKAIRIRVAEKDITITDYILDLVDADLNK